jgi:hypothetical protein
MIIFRKSINTNSFGLRGYWVHDKTTLSLWSFATSYNLNIGDNANPSAYELPRLEVKFKSIDEFNKVLGL